MDRLTSHWVSDCPVLISTQTRCLSGGVRPRTHPRSGRDGQRQLQLLVRPNDPLVLLMVLLVVLLVLMVLRVAEVSSPGLRCLCSGRWWLSEGPQIETRRRREPSRSFLRYSTLPPLSVFVCWLLPRPADGIRLVGRWKHVASTASSPPGPAVWRPSRRLLRR